MQVVPYTTSYNVGFETFLFDVDKNSNFYLIDFDGALHKHNTAFTEVSSGLNGYDASSCEKRLDNEGFCVTTILFILNRYLEIMVILIIRIDEIMQMGVGTITMKT